MDYTHKAINKQSGEVCLVEKVGEEYLINWMVQLQVKDWDIEKLPKRK